MVNPVSLQSLRLVLEALGTGEIPVNLSEILVAHFRTFSEDRAALLLEKRSGRGIHSFLDQLASGVDPVPGLERLTFVGADPYGMVHLMHLLFCVWVDIYSNSRRLFGCLVKLIIEGLPLVAEIPHKSFAARRPVRTVPRVDHITHLRGISPPNLQMKPC